MKTDWFTWLRKVDFIISFFEEFKIVILFVSLLNAKHTPRSSRATRKSVPKDITSAILLKLEEGRTNILSVSTLNLLSQLNSDYGTLLI